jgi:hypothetical protein
VKTSTLSRMFLAALIILGQPYSVCYSQQSKPLVGSTPVVSSRSQTVVSRDVRLNEGGRLSFQIVSLAGDQLADQKVTVSYLDTAIATAKSDASGRVSISGLRPGLHTISVSDSTQLYRFWTADTAPPAAITNPAVVVGAETALGQYGAPMMPMMAPGFLATTVTATALAAVLIGKNSGSDSKVVVPASP